MEQVNQSPNMSGIIDELKTVLPFEVFCTAFEEFLK